MLRTEVICPHRDSTSWLQDLWIYKPSIPLPLLPYLIPTNLHLCYHPDSRSPCQTMDLLSFLPKNLLPIMLTAIITFFFSEPVRLYYSYFIHITRNTRRLFEHMKHLEGRMKDLPHGSNAAKVWVSEMNSLKEEVDSFERDYKTWESATGLLSRWGRARYGIAMRAGDLLERVDLLDKKNVDTGRLPPLPGVQERDASSSILGLESALDEALTYLDLQSTAQSTASPPTHLDVAVPGPRVIGIFGIGGVGKTTLLKKINNFFASSPAHNVAVPGPRVIWATVSKDVNFEKLQEDVARGLGLSLHHTQSLQQRAEVIHNYMKDKRFLLLLDDLWEHLDLEELGIPNPQEGGSQLQRRVVFTTRLQNVCDSMQAMDAKKERIKVAFLSEDHAWQLFRRMLGDKFDDLDGELCQLAKAITKQCGGLPLALKVVGAAMSSRKSVEDWEYVLESLEDAQPISGMEEGIFRILNHSYDYLNNDKMRECLLCCALWPEDWSIDEDMLIQCWMGLGLLGGHRIDRKYRVGREYIQSLKDACLLEVGDKEDRQVKMHDVIRDMALQIASNKHKWMVQAGVGLKEAPRDVEQWEAAEKVSLMNNSIMNLPIFEGDEGSVEGTLELPKLSTLMLQHNFHSIKIPNNLYSCMPNLTYLDLSGNTFLEELPREICALTELQCLNLTSTGIKSLPQELGQLGKLKYLFLSNTQFLQSEVTAEVIPRMLQVLDLYKTFINWEAHGEIIFRRLKNLEVLGITVRSIPILQMISQLSHVQLWSIWIEKINSLVSLDIKQSLESIHMRNHLQKLNISELYNLKELKVEFAQEGSHRMAWNLRKLEALRLDSLSVLEEIVWRGVEAKNFLPRLRSLFISGCHKLENISWVSQLRCLEDLSVSCSHRMTTLIVENEISGGTEASIFPRLKHLKLVELLVLEVCHGSLAFPSLETIFVCKCPNLRSLSLRSPLTNSKLRQIKGRQTWWNNLQWEDENMRTSLQRHFVQNPN